MGCCGNTDNDNNSKPVGVNRPMSQLSKRNVGLTERTLRLRTCITCPNMVKSGDKAGVNKRDYCAWDKKKIRNKVKDGSETCYKGIWPVFEPGQEPRDEISTFDKAGMLISAGADMLSSDGYVPDEIRDERRSHCLTCIYRIPKHADKNIYDPNVIAETDICGICTCPVLSITKLVHKMCPDTPSKWVQYKPE